MPPATTPPPSTPERTTPPAPLVVAASIAAVQGVVAVLLAGLEALAFEPSRATMGVTTALFFVVVGGFLVVAAWGLWRLHSWARGPVLMAQLLWLGTAWSFRGGDTTWVAIGLAVSALVALGGLLHPESIQALEENRD